METKVIIDDDEYEDLLEIKRRYFALKDGEEKKDDQTGFGSNLESVMNEERKQDEKIEEQFDKSSSPPVKENKIETPDFKFVDHLNPRQRLFSKRLLQKLYQHNDFGINKEGEVMLNGVFIPGSDIVKLLRMVASTAKGKFIAGRDEFLEYLRNNNLHHFIKNKHLKSDPSGAGVETNMTFPSANNDKLKIHKQLMSITNEYDPYWYCMAD